MKVVNPRKPQIFNLRASFLILHLLTFLMLRMNFTVWKERKSNFVIRILVQIYE